MTDRDSAGTFPTEPFVAIPTRPVSGAPIATAWGADVHDRVFSPRGSVYTGVATPAVANVQTLLALTSKNAGGTWLNANRLVVPVGGAGLYSVAASGDLTGFAAGSSVRIRFSYRGSFSPLGSVSVVAGSSPYWGNSADLELIDGDAMGIEIFTSAAGSGTVYRLSLIRIGNSVAP